MQVRKIKGRGVLFTHSNPGWDLNVYLIIGRKYNYIIDTGLGSFSVEPIKEYLKDNNRTTIVINTHYHWDHIWGNGSLKDCIIVSHKLCREMIQSKWEEMIQKNNQYCYGDVEMYLPNLVFEKELYFAEDKIRLFHTPGHTLDSISVLDEEDGVVLLGDNIGDSIEDLIPSIYCEKDVYINTMKEYEEMDFDICISGHNTILKKDVIGKILNKI
jgi:glyoxylase-like metal-dependent hydrolase (beta-lactamase superfamily II)